VGLIRVVAIVLVIMLHATIEFTFQTNMQKVYCYTLDGSGEYLTGPIWNDFLKVNKN
jgi:hypothetical protein